MVDHHDTIMSTNFADVKILTGLNPQQKVAVCHDFTRHSLVLAGAGCGKTAVLTRRIIWCANQFCPPEQIMAVTFTRKAAAEMRERLHSSPDMPASRPGPTIATFHAFGFAVLRDSTEGRSHFQHLGYKKSPRILSEAERLALLARLTTAQERHLYRLNLTTLDHLLSQWAVAPGKLAAWPEETRCFAAEIGARFKTEKLEKDLWEYADMIELTIELFRQFPHILQRYATRISHLLVDEFQDTNPLQIDLLKMLLGGGAALFAVGDDDQAIYGFRGADTTFLHKFAEIFPGASILKLETNYRSRPAVLHAANRILKNKPREFRKVLVSGKHAPIKSERGAKPRCHLFPTETEMYAWIVAKAASLAHDRNIAVPAMALLFRVNDSADRARELLTMAGSTVLPQICTVHASKGLEFPVVFLCDLEESVFPAYRLREQQPIRSWPALFGWLFKKLTKKARPVLNLDEERRLFYVGVTRAQELLYCLSVRVKPLHNRTVKLKPSRFLKLIR
jgi:DNA helicase-2/ATP-dependent DNA helicase PcrA